MKKLVETILDIDELEKLADDSVRHSVVDYIDSSQKNVSVYAATEWPLLWSDISTNSYEDDAVIVNFDWCTWAHDDRARAIDAMDAIFGRVYFVDSDYKFVWSKTEKEIKDNIIKWVIPHLNDMGKYMIRKYRPKVEYNMCDHSHNLVRARGVREPFNNAHIEIMMKDTVLFYLSFKFPTTYELQK